ncbi:MAG: hypothetical protein M1816_001706 [Peltula sp. TS41687]|nr:MAG: hypothetical protein M1816_001706 [Peltula sp. TS41687]
MHGPFAHLLDRQPKDRFFPSKSIVEKGRFDQTEPSVEAIEQWGRPDVDPLNYEDRLEHDQFMAGTREGSRGLTERQRETAAQDYSVGFNDATRDDRPTLIKNERHRALQRTRIGTKSGRRCTMQILLMSSQFHLSSDKPDPQSDDWEESGLQNENDWMLHCLELQRHREVKAAEAKTSSGSQSQRGESTEKKEQADLNNQMRTDDGLWAPLKTLKGNAMNKLTQITHAINSVNNGKPGKLFGAPASPLIANPAVLGP